MLKINPEEVLHTHGFRNTVIRIKLLELFDLQKLPLSIPVIVKKMRRYKADTATIYRAIDAFVAAGIVRPISFGNDCTYYDLVRPSSHGHHIICEYCNAIESVPFCIKTLEKNVKQVSRLFKTISSHQLSFSGTCKKCARAVR